MGHMPTLQIGLIIRVGAKRKIGTQREAFGQRAVLPTAEDMNSVAARSFSTSASVMRPTWRYLNAPPLAHSTTSAMGCFLVVATRRAQDLPRGAQGNPKQQPSSFMEKRFSSTESQVRQTIHLQPRRGSRVHKWPHQLIHYAAIATSF